jgi:hypothetical protein
MHSVCGLEVAAAISWGSGAVLSSPCVLAGGTGKSLSSRRSEGGYCRIRDCQGVWVRGYVSETAAAVVVDLMGGESLVMVLSILPDPQNPGNRELRAADLHYLPRRQKRGIPVGGVVGT